MENLVKKTDRTLRKGQINLWLMNTFIQIRLLVAYHSAKQADATFEVGQIFAEIYGPTVI